MNLKAAALAWICLVLIACSGEDSVSTEDALANKPTIYGLGIPIDSIPEQHSIQPKLFNEFGLEINGSEGNWKFLAHPEFYMPVDQVVTPKRAQQPMISATKEWIDVVPLLPARKRPAVVFASHLPTTRVAAEEGHIAARRDVLL